ncbi:hypothetical protein [Aliarcobacter butzleri]|uniref:Tetratricopeptide repeat protein n=1 Tax=Aliarcobacter butzleri TaxID=28197 RepID=A0AAW6VDV8_9BACT|nr:hypothetical protein [Aliarcobacter butzleri]MDK2040329.1 hypothetical protein [Aliarcobacter butzleri]MDK2095885.1 hypothetical protein [Aliarcobacter butzleri]
MILRALFFIFILNINLFSCGYWIDPYEKEFIFLDDRNSPLANYSNLDEAAVYNTIIYEYERKNKEANLKEWQEELKNRYSIENIEDFIYKRKNLNLLRDNEISEYIKFVEKQESCVTYDYYKPVPIGCEGYIDEALNNIDKTTSQYLKLRYFYLAFRLAHFKQQEPLKIYEKYKYLLQNDTKTIVKDWIQGIYAGALIKNGQTVNGVYEFSKLLDESKINSHLSYYNFFHIKTNEQWNELLAKAQNNEEKTKFYALRSLKPESNILEELENIKKVDVNSKWLDFVLFRELLNYQLFFNQNEETVVELPKKYIEFLKTIKRDDMYLVNLSLAYFSIFQKNYVEASKYSKELLEKYPDSHEAQTLAYILYLEKLEKIDIKTENEIYTKMTELTKKDHTSQSIHDYTFVILEKLYKKQNDKFNAFLSKYINYLDMSAFDLELMERFEVFMKSTPDSKLKEYMQTSFSKQVNNHSYATKTRLLINNLKFQEALETNTPFLNEKIEFNPFNTFIKGNNRTGKQDVLTIKEFLTKMIVIKTELEKNPKSVMDNYLFANALYNLSYFGNSDRITTVYRSNYSIGSPLLQKEKLEKAIKHYNIALENSKDKEFQAKLTYMISKAYLALADLSNEKDRWKYYGESKYNYGTIYETFLQKNGAKYFDTLKQDFGNTKYYQELIQQCGDFKIYQKGKQ